MNETCIFIYQGPRRSGGQPKGKVCRHSEDEHCAYAHDDCIDMSPRRPCGGKGVHHPYHRPRTGKGTNR